MPQKKSSIIDSARQYTARAIAKSAKGAKKRITQRAREVKRARDRDFVARWKELKKLGVISTRNNPAVKRLTPKLKTKINKEFYSLQNLTSYSNGKTKRPLTRKEYKTPSGRKRVKYELDTAFKFLRTKKKTSALSELIKTKKGYIIKKPKGAKKISISNKGEVIIKSSLGSYRKLGIKGKKILKLQDDIESGKFKLRKNEQLVYRPYGSARVERMYDADTLDFFTDMINEYKTQMNHKTFEGWLDSTEILIITRTDV